VRARKPARDHFDSLPQRLRSRDAAFTVRPIAFISDGTAFPVPAAALMTHGSASPRGANGFARRVLHDSLDRAALRTTTARRPASVSTVKICGNGTPSTTDSISREFLLD
jgi:hypothetical protein